MITEAKTSVLYICNCFVTGLVISQFGWTSRIKQIPESQHRPRSCCFALGIHVGPALDPAMRQLEAVENWSHLHKYRPPVEGAGPHRVTGLPPRDQHMLSWGRLDETHLQRRIIQPRQSRFE